MIEYLEKLIIGNWLDWVGNEKPAKLDWLKIHAGEGWRSKKVGFFVFNNKKPVIFVKTVRQEEDNKLIEENFACLKKIYEVDKQSVPQPLYLGDCQGLKFSLETAIIGRQFHSCKKEADLNSFLSWFYDFQKSMKQEKSISLNNELERLANRFIDLYQPVEETKDLINKLAKELKTDVDNLILPAIIQHGDLTPDNVLNDGGQIKVIDWDHFGKIDLPLFDLLTFLQRWSGSRDVYFVSKYLKIIEAYLQEFGIKRQALKALVFSYYLWDFLRKKEQLTDYDQEFLAARLKELKELKI